MNLFLKIFLWFLAAITAMTGVVAFLNWTVQTEPVVSHWRSSVQNQMRIYAATAGQIYEAEGEAGMSKFVERLASADTVTEVGIFRGDGTLWIGNAKQRESYQSIVGAALASSQPLIDLESEETSVAARSFGAGGAPVVLVVRWERPHPPSFLGDTQMRYLRYGGLLITGLLLCYALAAYLSSPIAKLRDAAQTLAAGDLTTRVGPRVGRRRDELSELARDFDVMAERIESLVTSQKRLSRDVSHELRSPLARMNVALEIAKQKNGGELSPLLQRIETESGRLNEMISRLLTLARLETVKRSFKKERIDLPALVRRIAEDGDFEARAKDKSVRILRLDSCTVSGSENLLQSAIENVLRNAVSYTAQATTVDVSVLNDGANAVVVVEDHGGGIPPDALEKVFQPFYRVSESRERRTGGMGLGLAIAHQAVCNHDGSITALNTDDGLRVEISLPLDG